MLKTVLENEFSQVTINHHGAELSSFILKADNLEFIWQADPEYWARHAPVLFPFVGRLKNDEYIYAGKTYPMGQHGFARDMEFTLETATNEAAVFLLKSNEDTLKVYPFVFELRLFYTLEGKELILGYEVTTESDEMYFSIGGHPAFNVPLEEGTKFGDYYINFSPTKSRFLLPLEGPYINLQEKTLGQTNTAIQLNRQFFKNDAFILETLGENSFSIRADKTDHSVTLSYKNLPYVGVWSPYPKEAPFVCIEPWLGIADTTEATGLIEEKLGINRIVPGDSFKASYSIKID